MSLPDLSGRSTGPEGPRATRLRRVLAGFRRVGTQLHPHGEQADDFLVDLLCSAATGQSRDDFVQRWPDASVQHGLPVPWGKQDQLGEPEQIEIPPDQASQLGINKGRFPIIATGDPVVDPARMEGSAAVYGWMHDMLCDIATAGGTVTRQLGYCELTWQWLFDMGEFDEGDGEEPPAPEPIPPPDEIYRRLTEEGHSYLARFNLMLLACVVYRTRIVPTLFTYDGGSELNDRQDEDGGHTPINDRAGDDITYETAKRVSPYRKSTENPLGGVIVPAQGGWDPFYWEPSEVGVAGWSVFPNLQDFQKYCLNITTWPDYDGNAYMEECARRKSLALAAFGLAIGEHLATWDAVLTGVGSSITDVILYLELGNEMSVHWGADRDLFEDAYRTGGYELGSFMALLAGAVHTRCSQVRFSAPGIASWGNSSPSVWSDRVDWVRQAIALGMPAELSLWSRVREGMSLSTGSLSDAVAFMLWAAENPDAAAWLETSEAAGFTAWPPPSEGGSIPLSSLMHHVNMHWFHANDMTGDSADNQLYAADGRFLDDIEVFKTALTHIGIPDGAAYLTLSWSLHPGGFPADRPSAAGPDSGWSSFASPLFQAGMVHRLLLLPLTQGAELASWHTHMAGIKAPGGSGWSQYSVMGLRQDIGVGGTGAFRAAQDAFRRPGWYAFRRLAALLSRAESVELLIAQDGLYVVALESSAGFRDPPESSLNTLSRPLVSTTPAPTWSRAFIAWLDQGDDSDATSQSFSLTDLAGDGALRLSLAPQVLAPDAAIGTDDYNYATGETVDWEWTVGGSGRRRSAGSGHPSLWATTVADWTSVADVWMGRGRISVTVYRASRLGRPVPLCLLTNAQLSPQGVGDTTTRSGATSFWSRAKQPGRPKRGPAQQADVPLSAASWSATPWSKA